MRMNKLTVCRVYIPRFVALKTGVSKAGGLYLGLAREAKGVIQGMAV